MTLKPGKKTDCAWWLSAGVLMLVLAVGHYLMPQSNRYLEGYTAGGIWGRILTHRRAGAGGLQRRQGIAP